MTREEEVERRPVIPLPFSQAKQIMLGGLSVFLGTKNKTKMLLEKTMAGIILAYQQLSPEDREALDEGSGEAGFVAGVSVPRLFPRDVGRQEQWAQMLAAFLSSQTSATGAGHVGCRGCGCGTPGCNKGAGAKMSPGFLAKVRRHLAKL